MNDLPPVGLSLISWRFKPCSFQSFDATKNTTVTLLLLSFDSPHDHMLLCSYCIYVMLYAKHNIMDVPIVLPVPRFRERPVSPHVALPCVASFPPAALLAFIGTIRLSDSLCLICLPPSSVVQHTLNNFEGGTGPPGLPCNPDVRHAMVSDPGEANIALPIAVMSVLTSTS